MDLSSFVHETKSAYSYAFNEDTLHLRVKTRKNDIHRMTLLAVDPFNWRPSAANPQVYEFAVDSGTCLPMKKEYTTQYHDCWFAEVTGFSWRRFKYAFLLEDGRETVFAGCHEFVPLSGGFSAETLGSGDLPAALRDYTNYYNYPFIADEDLFRAPDWVKDTVWYQIFPDRFRRGKEEADSEFPAWGSEARDGADLKFGGNLAGIIEKLDYIREFGATGIYFTPLFDSPSSHKYDIRDYLRIDPAFGDNDQFRRLVQEAHRRGIRVMLDAVFNHCGSEHPFWQDVLKNGKASPYFSYFHILDPEQPVWREPEEGELNYFGEHLNFWTFAYTERMPKWNTGNPAVRDYLIGAAEYWIREYDIDGWRLDVANEVSHDFWREFRKRVKALKPELFLLGENWYNSLPWLGGDQFDSVMNYEFTSPATRYFGVGRPGLEAYGASEFVCAVNQLLVSFPKNVTPNLFTLLDSHDTARILHLCGDDVRRVKQAYLFQLTFAGTPSIYYGGEIGLGGDEQHNRQCMPWESERQDRKLFAFLQRLIRLRSEYSAFRAVDLEWLAVDDASNAVLYRKQDEAGALYVALHPADAEAALALDGELAGAQVLDLESGDTVKLGSTLRLEPFGFRLFYRAD
ncbi:glycoside hydrolase family 13 protein [Gorillibacterium sp. sgz500922]|uniref:glycoside hydrolase family 13 protein n=1 Tax=Gorillibacterium sp. sgz500922 TaxID=3446694 RepID=UPI003F660F55